MFRLVTEYVQREEAGNLPNLPLTGFNNPTSFQFNPAAVQPAVTSTTTGSPVVSSSDATKQPPTTTANPGGNNRTAAAGTLSTIRQNNANSVDTRAAVDKFGGAVAAVPGRQSTADQHS